LEERAERLTCTGRLAANYLCKTAFPTLKKIYSVDGKDCTKYQPRFSDVVGKETGEIENKNSYKQTKMSLEGPDGADNRFQVFFLKAKRNQDKMCKPRGWPIV
jgi:hypothetical protein